MRIAIDIREYSHTPAGIGNYCAGLAAGLAGLAEDEELLLYGHNVFPAGAVGRNVRHCLVSNGWRFGWRRSLWENIVLPFDLLRKRVDVFHATSHLVPPLRYGEGLVLTVHDMTNFLFPEWYPRRNNAYRTRMIRRGIRNAKAVIAVSPATARDVERFFPDAGEKVHVIYEGIDPVFHPESPDPVPTLPAVCEGRFVLFVGTLSPRKNVRRLIEAFAEFARRPKNNDIHLILVGMRGWMYEDVDGLAGTRGLEGRIHYVGFVSQEVLAEMYRRAVLFCLPSLYEGFGLPVLEAMACGTPALASDRSSFPELVADEASLVNPENVEAMAERMDLLVNDESLRERIVREGLRKARDFSWERAARETLRVYRAAHRLE